MKAFNVLTMATIVLVIFPALSFASTADDCFGIAATQASKDVLSKLPVGSKIELMNITSSGWEGPTSSRYGAYLKAMTAVGKIISGSEKKEFEVLYRMNEDCEFIPGGQLTLK
jgi:hypothetical protein